MNETLGATLSDADVRTAAGLLLDARAGRAEVPALPAELTPVRTEDIQRIIDAVSAEVDRPVLGWKTYSVHKPMHPPFVAPIYDVFASGATIPASISPARLIEPEIMFRVDRELPARDHNYDITEILDAVTAIVGFEVIGSRFRGQGQGSLYGSLSDHAANGAVVAGDPIPNWRTVAFEDVSLQVFEDDQEQLRVVGCHPHDNPFLPVVTAVNRVRRRTGLHAGDIIVTNSSTGIMTPKAGSVVRAVYEGLGEVTASFAA